MSATRIFTAIFAVFFVCCFSVRGPAQEAAPKETTVKEVLRFDFASAPNLLEPDKGRPYGEGFTLEDGVYVCDNGEANDVGRGVSFGVTLNQEVPGPIFAELRSKAENVGGSPSSDYGLYLDLTYIDGTQLWGQTASFATGTHDWQRIEVVVFPEKPVKSLTCYGLFRNKSGKAYFRDMKLSAPKLDASASLFDGVPVLVPDKLGSTDVPQIQVRDVVADSHFWKLDEKMPGLRCQTQASLMPAGDDKSGQATTVRLELDGKADRCLTVVFSVPFDKDREPTHWCENRKNVPLSEARNREYVGPTSHYPVGVSGRLSKYPFAAVLGPHPKKSDEPRGYCVGIDMEYPAFFRTGYNEATRELFVAVDLALTPESPVATLRFVVFGFDAQQGFRGAVDRYYRMFPEFFRVRIPEQGVWMPFAAISKVPNHADFGFRFKEGNDETAWDDANEILTFRYTEPMTWWMALPEGAPRTYEAALAHAQKLADDGNAYAKALFVCGMRDAEGRIGHRMLDTPWCNGVVWSFCDLPGLEGGGFGVNWNDGLMDRLYFGPDAQKNGVLDGEYVDSSEGYVTEVLNYERKHFAAARCPLVFDRPGRRPAIFRGLVAYEYVRKMAEDLHPRGKLTMANSTPHVLPWLAPYLDICGTETNWNYGGQWHPTSDDELMFRRILCGAKPYCFLMNTEFTQWTYEMSEKFMKRSLAYGMFPGYFSADASTGHYFTRPELYDRDRPLFKKYVPLCKRVAQAGWQPLPLASCDDEKVYVERFGDFKDDKTLHFTVFNDSAEEKTVTIRFEPPEKRSYPTTPWTDLVSGKSYTMRDRTIRLTLGPEDVAVLARP